MDNKASPSKSDYYHPKGMSKNIHRPREPNPAEPGPADEGVAKEGETACEGLTNAESGDVAEATQQVTQRCDSSGGEAKSVLTPEGEGHPACEEEEIAGPFETVEEAPPAPTLPPDIQSLVAEAQCKEESGWKEDKKNFDNYMKEAQSWANQCATLLRGIESAVQNCDDLLSGCEKAKESLPSELQDKLQGRQEGLRLTGKMAARLRERTTGLVDDATIETSLTFIGEHEWGNLLANETNEELARKTIDESLKNSGVKRYQLISQARELAEGRRKRLLSFVEKQVLPILDGLDNGERHSESLVEQAMAENQDLKETLKAWLGTYNTLREQFLNVLAQVGVHLMAVEIRAPIDYARHEPFDVESDPDLPNEHIKAVIRNGYEYAAEAGGNSLVLRAAQVIVVKN